MLCWFLAGRWGSAGELSLAVDSWAMDSTHTHTLTHTKKQVGTLCEAQEWGELWVLGACGHLHLVKLQSLQLQAYRFFLCLHKKVFIHAYIVQACRRTTVYQGIECYIYLFTVCYVILYSTVQFPTMVCIFFSINISCVPYFHHLDVKEILALIFCTSSHNRIQVYLSFYEKQIQ